MERILLLLFLISILLISGCVEQPFEGAITEGIKINEFSPDRSTIYTRDSVGLNLEVQNVGEVPGTLREVMVYGVDTVSGSTPNPSKWAEGSPVFDLTMDEILDPSSPSFDFEGESRSFRWKPKAPTDIKTPTTYDFRVRVKYDYETRYMGTIRVVKASYLDTLPEDERENLIKQGGVVSSSVTGGPLSLSVLKGRHFIIYEGETTQSRPIKFEITNVGSGFPYSGEDIGPDTMYKVNIFAASGDGFTCPIGTNIKLSKGESGIFSCNFNPPASIQSKVDMLISITFDYNYATDAVTLITVNPE